MIDIENRSQNGAKIEKIYELLGTYKQIILANFTNVSSTQIHQVRKILRAYDAHFVIEKNTLIKRIIKMRTDGVDEDKFKYLVSNFGGIVPELKSLTPLIKDKVALIFTNAPTYQLKEVVEAIKVPVEAKVDALAPIDFTIYTGRTGLDPACIRFFYALNISTKICSGQIETTKDFKVCTKGHKINVFEVEILKKLNIKPFWHGLKLIALYDNGSIIPEEMIGFNPTKLLSKIHQGICNIAGLSLSIGYPFNFTVPNMINTGFHNMIALSLGSSYQGPEINHSTFISPTNPGHNKAESLQQQFKEKKVQPKEESLKKEEENQADMQNLFS